MLLYSYSYMIDNIVLLITGTLHQRAISELIPKCHPLGSFEQMEALHIASTPAELYNAVLVDTPLGELDFLRFGHVSLFYFRGFAVRFSHVGCLISFLFSWIILILLNIILWVILKNRA